MKRITYMEMLEASKKLIGDCFTLYITNAKYTLQTMHTEKALVNMSTNMFDWKQKRIQNIMLRYSTLFRKAFLYVTDEDYVKYF